MSSKRVFYGGARNLTVYIISNYSGGTAKQQENAQTRLLTAPPFDPTKETIKVVKQYARGESFRVDRVFLEKKYIVDATSIINKLKEKNIYNSKVAEIEPDMVDVYEENDEEF